MPDYSIVKSLCEELEVTVAELLDGEKAEEKVFAYTMMNKCLICCEEHKN